MKIYSGKNIIDIKVKEDVFREQTFGVIYINKEKTSLTTQMGKDWLLWQSLRELYSNALDEPGTLIEVVDEICAVSNETHFYIGVNEDVTEFLKNFDKYFSVNKEILFESKFGKITNNADSSVCIYRKGIRCADYRSKSVYDYDFNDILINESRLIESKWRADEALWQLFVSCTDETILEEILKGFGKDGYFERNLTSIATLFMSGASKEFTEFIYKTKIAPIEKGGLLTESEILIYNLVPMFIYDELEKLMLNENKPSFLRNKIGNNYFEVAEMSLLHIETLRRSNEFFDTCDYKIEYPIQAVIFADSHTLGMAADDTIYVSLIAIEKGVHDLCNTIIEEQIHLKYNVRDETREFQLASINEMLTVMKKAYAFAM